MISLNLTTLITVYLAFLVKHFLCDYPLQRQWMLDGKGRLVNWFWPLAAHAGVHALGTLLIALVVRPDLWWLALVDLVVHFAINRVKSHPMWGGRWHAHQAQYWWALGFDQTLHQLTHFIFVLALIGAFG